MPKYFDRSVAAQPSLPVSPCIHELLDTVARQFDRVCEVLATLGYLAGDEVTDLGRPLRRIVTGYDGSPDADACLDVIANMPFRSDGGAAIMIVTAFDVAYPFQSGIAPTMHDAITKDYEADLRIAERDATATAARGVEHRTRAAARSDHRGDIAGIGVAASGQRQRTA